MACTGTPTLDQSQTGKDESTTVLIQYAYGQKFTPTSKCLKQVTLNVQPVQLTKLEIFIMKDNGASPRSTPDSQISDNQYIGSASIVPTDLTQKDYSFVFNPPLEFSDMTPKWIVFTSGYDPNYSGYQENARLYKKGIPNQNYYTVQTLDTNNVWSWVATLDYQYYYETYKMDSGTTCPDCTMNMTQ